MSTTQKKLVEIVGQEVIIKSRATGGDTYLGGTMEKSGPAPDRYHVRYQDPGSGHFRSFHFQASQALYAGQNKEGKHLIEVDRNKK